MSIVKPVMSVKDSVVFTLSKAELTGKQVGEYIVVPERDITTSDGLKWWVQMYPAGKSNDAQNHLSLFLHVNKAVSAKYCFTLHGALFIYPRTYNFSQPGSIGHLKYASYETLLSLFFNGPVLPLTCEVEFDISVPFAFLKPCLAQCCDHIATDFKLLVGSNWVPAHKSFLSLMSPVFHAMLSHDTVESKSGRMEITDFDFGTVKTVIDFCYGRLMKTPSVEVVVSMLRFADKYGMKPVTNLLEKLPRANLSVATFPTIVQYAYDCSKDALFAECAQFFKEHEAEIKPTQNFVNLPLKLLVHILKAAFDLKTFSDIFKHAHNNGFAFIIERLQNLTSISFDTFPIAASYAWANSCDNLKKMCATFFNVNRDAVMSMKAFVDLTPEVVYGVFKLGFELKNGLK